MFSFRLALLGRMSIFLTVFSYIILFGWATRTLLSGPRWSVILVCATLIGIIIATFAIRLLELLDGNYGSSLFSILLLPALFLMSPFIVLEFCVERLRWPKTVDQAVDRLLTELSEEEKARLCEKAKVDWFGLGLGIRNSFGLSQGNMKLIDSCGVGDSRNKSDSACAVIINRLLDRLQQDQH